MADSLGREEQERVRALSPDERLRLSFRLGDEDAELYAAAAGIPLDEARRRLRAQRQLGRRPSRCFTDPAS